MGMMLAIAAAAVVLSVVLIYAATKSMASRKMPVDEEALKQMSPAQARVYLRRLEAEKGIDAGENGRMRYSREYSDETGKSTAGRNATERNMTDGIPAVNNPAGNSSYTETELTNFRSAWTHSEFMSLTERFYELVFSATSILLFVGIYFQIDYFGIGDAYRSVWETYNGLILLLFILISVMLNSFVDNIIIPLDHVRPGERATMRLAGMVYMIVVFAYIKFFYEDSNYDSIILYFLTLVIGRFVYFDASLESFSQAMKDVFTNIPLLLLALLSTGLVALVGFRSGYLLTQNGVVLNLFIGQLYLLAVIFVIHHGFRMRERKKIRRGSRKDETSHR